MYLHQIVLDAGHPRARQDLADPYQLHRTLERGMTASDDSCSDRYLWRLESASAERATLLVQSPGPAHWERIEAAFPGLVLERQTREFPLARVLVDGARVRFRLRCNPTVCRDGKRHALVRLDEQFGWLRRQFERGGLALGPANRLFEQRLTTRQDRTRHLVTLHVVQFEGEARVRDVVAAQGLVAAGVGRAKGFGLGLLSIAPLAGER